ncbi:hypothetical protein RI367_008089 [Sorochytrium milnesiophthora]
MPAILARSLAMALFAVLYVIALEQSEARVLSYSRSFVKREIPQEHSHDFIIDAMRPSFALDTHGIAAAGQVPDPIFGILGTGAANKNAIDGNGDCLQQRTADRAITNIKAKQNGDKKLIAAAVKYRALERNAVGVGSTTPACNERPQNAELLGISQHQDPASPNAAAVNKAVELAVAKRLAELGQDPLDAKQTGTFAPGNLKDFSGHGLSCDGSDCILQNNRLVPAATDDELRAAAGSASTSSSNSSQGQGQSSSNAAPSATATCPPNVTVTVTVTAGQAEATGTANANNDRNRASGRRDRDQEQREKQQRDKAQREKQQREKAQREKAQREKAQREKQQREKQQREKQQREKQQQGDKKQRQKQNDTKMMHA